MPTYITLVKWTEQGVRNVKDTVTRVEQVRAAAEKSGGRLIGSWWTQGAYDIVAIFEAPDDETFSALALSPSRCSATSARSRWGPTQPRRCIGSSRSCPEAIAPVTSLATL